MEQSNWKEAYRLILTKKERPIRLRELLQWDKPIVERENDPNNLWVTWDQKVQSLLELIKETSPSAQIVDEKLIL